MGLHRRRLAPIKRPPGPPLFAATFALARRRFAASASAREAPSSPRVQPSAAVAQEGRWDRKEEPHLVYPSVVAVSRQSTAVAVNPKLSTVAAALAAPFVVVHRRIWSPLPPARKKERKPGSHLLEAEDPGKPVVAVKTEFAVAF
uniref:Uncharacterized protein n=1 Tax=Oryza meridionalis TaxID=40149 RepID=A0A0E0DBQ7_9ORYZ